MHRRDLLRYATMAPGLGLLTESTGLAAGKNPSRFAHLPKPPDVAFTLGVQYFRAPFPLQQHWESDISRMKDAGLNTVQLWVMWPWVEAKPGKFVFDDYDRLVELVAKNNLGLIISTIAEVHPHWLSKVVPNSEMIDHTGAKVVSSNRSESHFGLTPGGCFDHPGVWERMRRFIDTVVTRYHDAPHLRAWDIWNETRWNVQAENFVCFCPHTLRAFRGWLSKRYGGLSGLNETWQRRYGSWEEVMPGKLPRRTYTEMMAWTQFITERSNEQAKKRYELIKTIDPIHPATLHGASPCEHHGGNVSGFSYPLERGNDFAFADVVDGVGSSVFPTWWHLDDTALAIFSTYVHSAARGKHAWFSEVQGGRASQGSESHDPVLPSNQQKWIWGAIAGGIDTLLFWCWRDEIFGGESAGYGLVGNDGYAEPRLTAMRKTAALLEKHKVLIKEYRPPKPKVALLFSPQSYYLHFAQSGSGAPPQQGLEYYARALTRSSIPWIVIEEEHLDALSELSIVFMPRGLVTNERVESALVRFVENGGTLLVEAECGAYSPQGFYRLPEERFLAKRFGIRELGRRTLPTDNLTIANAGKSFSLPAAQWITPLNKASLPNQATTIWCEHTEGPLIVDVKSGRGRVIHVGAYLGDAERGEKWTLQFEEFISFVAGTAGVQQDAVVVSPASSRATKVIVRAGASGETPLVFVMGPPETEFKLKFRKGLFGNAKATDLISGRAFSLTNGSLTLPPSAWGLAVLQG